MLERPNVLVLDEPTNHLDLESIEALVEGLREYDGTLILVSHDRWFVGELATRIVEITPEEVVDYPGTYHEYVASRGDDHLDADAVLLRHKREKKEGRKDGNRGSRGGNGTTPPGPSPRKGELEKRSRILMERLEEVEARIPAIDATFAEPGYFDRAPEEEVRALEEERAALQAEAARLMEEWEVVERKLGALEEG
jgi:energy-coupling factor transporter ATP-binding protein EcfA2